MDDHAAETQSGAEALVRTLIAGGIDTCFANPGTSEMHFVAALDRIPGIQCVLGLQENVVTGMADGYFRMTGRPAATLLHCGPGYANGIANIHNARRAGSGMLNIVGDHAIPHVAHDSPLTSDVAALVGATSQWHAFGTVAERIGLDAARALEAAAAGYGQIASLVLPADVSWSDGGTVAQPRGPVKPMPPDPEAIRKAASTLRSGRKVLILLGTAAVALPLHPLLAGLAVSTGAELMGSPTIARIPRGRGRLNLPMVPYPVDDAIARLASYDALVLVNCPPPVGFFRYPGRPSLLHRPDADVVVLSRPDQDAASALEALARELNVKPGVIPGPAGSLPDVEGAITPASLAAHVARLLPENALVVAETITSGTGFPAAMPHAAPVDWIAVTGGAIGGGPPLATGAAVGLRAIGEGNRPVIALQADGSAAYTLQAFWTQAREQLPIITLLLNNKSYAILLGEYQKVGANPGATARAMMSLEDPPIDWCSIARGFGLDAAEAPTHEALEAAFLAALQRRKPTLINVHL